MEENKNAATEEKEKEPYSRTSDEKIEQLINAFSDISKEAEQAAEMEKSKPKFIIQMQDYDLEQVLSKLNTFQEEIEALGFEVLVLDDLEFKNASKGSKYTIRIQNNNGVYVETDLLEYKEKIKEWDFDEVSYISQLISKITGDTSQKTNRVGRIIAEYLSILIYYPERFTKIYTNIGWDYLDNELIFKYDRIHSGQNYRSQCIDSVAESLQPRKYDDDEKMQWVSFAISMMNYSTVDSLLFGAGISGLCRQLLSYTKETNININVVGERASGKSTIGHFIVSIFGDPSKLEGSFVDTTNKVDEIRAKRSVLPYVLDERMLRVEETNDRARKRAIVMDIFREYEGKVKERIGKQYSSISGERTCGPIISSSVRSIMDEIYDYADLGQFRRFIELKIVDTDLFMNKDMAEEAERVANSYYGYGIELIISYLLEKIQNNNEYVEERFLDIKDMVNEYLSRFDIKGIESSSMRFSLIILSYQILRESLLESVNILNGGIETNIIEDKSEDILKLLATNIISKMEVVNSNIKKKSTLPEYIKRYKNAFFEFKGKDIGWHVEEGKQVPYIGKIKAAEHAIELIIRQPYGLELILFSYKDDIPDPVQIRKYIDICEDNPKSPEVATMLNRLKRIEKEDINEFLTFNPWISIEGRDTERSKKFGSDRGERALIIRIDLDQYQEGGQV